MNIGLISSGSAEQLRVKSGKTMVALCAGKGIAIVAEGLACANEVEQHFAAVVLPDLQRRGQCGKEAFLLTSTLGYFWCIKSNSPAATERNDYLI